MSDVALSSAPFCSVYLQEGNQVFICFYGSLFFFFKRLTIVNNSTMVPVLFN